MRVERRLLDGKGREDSGGAGNSSSRKNKRRQRRPRPPAQTLVQRLFDTCRGVFSHGEAGGVPSQADVERIRCVLDQIEGKDVGVTEDMPCLGNVGDNGRRPPVTYLSIREYEDKFSICIFYLPPSAVIPLHDHPGMTVFSRLLFGCMHVKSYDWVDDSPHEQADGSNNSPQACPAARRRLAKVKTDAILSGPCKASVLYPASGGNMHCFTALTPCAILDVLGPPYSKDETRPCTYYSAHPCTSSSGDSVSPPGDNGHEGYAWLEEREVNPDDFPVVRGEYTGPAINYVEN